jgi:hypothetical protein
MPPVPRYKNLFEKAGNQIFLLLLLANFLAPGSGFGFTFPVQLRIRESPINAEIYADPDAQHFFSFFY